MITVILKQQTACFSLPTPVAVQLTYPLPPPSTVYGFLRAMTGNYDISHRNTSLSIQGRYGGKAVSLEKVLRMEKEKDIIRTYILYDCEWRIHVVSSYEKQIKDCLLNPTRIPRLGRREDVVFDIVVKDDSVEEIKNLTDLQKNNNIYVDLDVYRQNHAITGSAYRLSYDIEVSRENGVPRIYHLTKTVLYTNTGRLGIYHKDVKVDSEGYPVHFIPSQKTLTSISGISGG